jgi:hypothetical protein
MLADLDGIAEGAEAVRGHEVSGKCVAGDQQSKEIVGDRDLEVGGLFQCLDCRAHEIGSI